MLRFIKVRFAWLFEKEEDPCVIADRLHQMDWSDYLDAIRKEHATGQTRRRCSPPCG